MYYSSRSVDDWMPQSFGSAPGHYFRVFFCHQGFVSQSTLKMMSQQLCVWCFCNPVCSHRCCIVNHSLLIPRPTYRSSGACWMNPYPASQPIKRYPFGRHSGTSWGETVVDSHRYGMVICDWMGLDWPIIWNLLSWMR